MAADLCGLVLGTAVVNLHIGWRGTGAAIGLIGGAALWAINTQLGQVLPYPDCRHQLHSSGFASLAAIALSVILGVLSWRAFAKLRQHAGHASSDARRSLYFLAGLGAGAAALFVFALLLQMAAGFLLTGCER